MDTRRDLVLVLVSMSEKKKRKGGRNEVTKQGNGENCMSPDGERSLYPSTRSCASGPAGYGTKKKKNKWSAQMGILCTTRKDLRYATRNVSTVPRTAMTVR